MRLKDNLGQTTEITFRDIDRNAPIDPQAFSFEPPAGIDVIHGTGS
jgi:outer membrane lipoprotein carrier protein